MSHLKTIGEQVGVRNAPGQRPEIHDRDETRQVEHLALQVLAVAQAAQVEQLRAWQEEHKQNLHLERQQHMSLVPDTCMPTPDSMQAALLSLHCTVTGLPPTLHLFCCMRGA